MNRQPVTFADAEEKLITRIQQVSGKKFAPASKSFLVQKAEQRISELQLSSLEDYLIYTDKHPEEIKMLQYPDIESWVNDISNLSGNAPKEDVQKKRENFYRALIEKSIDMKALVTAEGNLIYGSPSISKFLGIAPFELLQQNLFDMIHEEDKFSLSKKIESTFNKSTNSFKINLRFRQNNKWGWCEARVTNLLNDKYINALVFSILDVSEKKLAEEKLKNSEANLNTIFNNSDTAYVLLDEQFRIITFNLVAKKWAALNLGLLFTEGQSFTEILPPEKRESFIRILLNALRGRPASLDESYQTANNDTMSWFQIKINRITNDDRKTLGLCIAINDITRRKLYEQERDRMTADLVQRNKDLEQFAYIVSHNLRSPVANIIGFVNAISSEDYNLSAEEKREVMTGIDNSVQKLDTVIKDLNEILRINRQAHDKKEMVDLAILVEDIIISISNKIKDENAEIRTDFTGLPEIFTNRSYLHSIFYNLINNSIKYRRQDVNPVIKIKSILTGEKIKLTFSDNGSGIDLVKNAEQVFGLYKRFHRNIDGKGMGLFMVKAQVENLGGKIEVKSEVNRGTEFTIELNHLIPPDKE